MKNTNYMANDVVVKWLNKSVALINVMLQFLNIYRQIAKKGRNKKFIFGVIVQMIFLSPFWNENL